MIIFDFACKDRKISENYSYICSKSCEKCFLLGKERLLCWFLCICISLAIIVNIQETETF